MTTLQARPTHGVANPNFPSLSDDALGALKLAWRWANVEDDWTKNGEIADNWDRWTGWPYMAKLTYGLTYVIRLAGKLSQEIPGWREILGDTAEKCLNRMFQYGGWCDWVEQPGLDPNIANYPSLYYKHTIPRGYAGVINAPGYAGNGLSTGMDCLFQSMGWASTKGFRDLPGRLGGSNKPPYLPQHAPAVGRTYDPDPIYGNGSSNMMYRGYLMEQLSLTKAITGTTKYEGKNQLVYDENIHYAYSPDEIARGLSEQLGTSFDPNGSSLKFGVDCEVGKAFPLCIAVGGLGTQLHDAIYGTSYIDTYLEWLEFGKTWIAGGSDPNGPVEWCVPYYARDINYNMTLPEQSVPLFWTGTAHEFTVHDRGFAERIYQGCINRYGKRHDDGSLQILLGPDFTGDLPLSDLWGEAAALTCAQELGDMETHDALKLYMDNHYQPTRNDGEAYYTFGLDEPWPRGIPNHIIQWSWAGEPGSLKRMYTSPDMDKFDQPTVQGVDFPNLTIRQAHNDAGVFHIAVEIGRPTAEGKDTRFRVTTLDPGKTREVTCGGEQFDNWTQVGPTEIEINTKVGPAYFTVR